MYCKRYKTRDVWARFILMLTVVAIALVGTFGVSAGMSQDQQAAMPNCVVTNEAAAVCQMDVAEHLAMWQQLFLAAPLPGILLLLVVIAGFTNAFLWYRRLIVILVAQAYHRYQQAHPDARTYDYLLRVLSQGLLQPRLYA